MFVQLIESLQEKAYEIFSLLLTVTSLCDSQNVFDKFLDQLVI